MQSETWQKGESADQFGLTYWLEVFEPANYVEVFGPLRITMPEWLVDSIIADHTAASTLRTEKALYDAAREMDEYDIAKQVHLQAQLTAANERAERNQDAAIEAQRRVQDAEDKARWANERAERYKATLEELLPYCYKHGPLDNWECEHGFRLDECPNPNCSDRKELEAIHRAEALLNPIPTSDTGENDQGA